MIPRLIVAMSLVLVPLVIVAEALSPSPYVRFAYSNDGNYHDTDDIGAAAMMQAILWRAGARDRVAYVEHSSHIGANSQGQHAAMVLSATGNAPAFGIPLDRVFDQFLEPGASASALAAAIDASGPGRPLVFFQSGPWESMARGFDLADPAKHRWVKIISHSNWNDTHEHQSRHRDKADFFAQYDSGGQFDGFIPPDYEKIDDQNGYAFNSPMSGDGGWAWLSSDQGLAFVLERTLASGSAAGDMSDAGMVFWYLTGIEHPTMDEVRSFLE